MSNEKKKSADKRPYTLKKRARRQEQVHRRITLAAVYFHETVGPAKTTMNAIAKRAGVQRATVYNHFPTDLELIDACSSHWFVENPPPDPRKWVEIVDPIERAKRSLAELYDYYDRSQAMLSKVLRDVPLVPALEEIVTRKWQPFMQEMIDALMARRYAPGPTVRASMLVALDYFTWERLTHAGLSNAEASKLAAIWINASGNMAAGD